MKRKISLLILVLGLVISACNTSTTIVSGIVPTKTISVQASPTIAPGKGDLVGTLVEKGTSPEKPYAGLRVYLGVLVYNQDKTATVAKVDQLTAPQAFTDENGRFTFKDLAPGQYILVAQLPPNNLIKLKDPQTGEEMLLEVQAGKIKDLGKLAYDFPNPTEQDIGPTVYPLPQNTPSPYP
jgi:hypothetical protein